MTENGDNAERIQPTTSAGTKLWLIDLQWDGQRLYTLWGYDLDNENILLGGNRKLFCFRSLSALARFVISDAGCNLSHLTAYLHLRQSLRMGTGIADACGPMSTCDFDEVQRLLTMTPTSWSIPVCSQITDGLNMLTDIARTIQNREVIDTLNGDGLLGKVANAATFANQDDLKAVTEMFDTSNIVRTFRTALDDLRLNVSIIESLPSGS